MRKSKDKNKARAGGAAEAAEKMNVFFVEFITVFLHYTTQLLDMKKLIFLFPVILMIAIASCNEKEEAEVAEKTDPKVELEDDGINPNGSSELALLMRAMFNDGEVMKQAVEAGKMPEVVVPYHKITTATPTNRAEVETESFKNISKAYLEAMENLENAATPEEAREQYKVVINTCISCHMNACPGPISKIRKLELQETEL